MYDTARQINNPECLRMTVQNDKPVHADAPRPANPAQGGPVPLPTQPKPVPASQPAAAKPAAAQPAAAQPNPAAGGAAAPRPVPAAPARPVPQMPPPQAPVKPAASTARLKPRHLGVAASFVVIVLLPILVSTWYLYARAEDQYASYMGFTVRS